MSRTRSFAVTGMETYAFDGVLTDALSTTTVLAIAKIFKFSIASFLAPADLRPMRLAQRPGRFSVALYVGATEKRLGRVLEMGRKKASARKKI